MLSSFVTNTEIVVSLTCVSRTALKNVRLTYSALLVAMNYNCEQPHLSGPY